MGNLAYKLTALTEQIMIRILSNRSGSTWNGAPKKVKALYAKRFEALYIFFQVGRGTRNPV